MTTMTDDRIFIVEGPHIYRVDSETGERELIAEGEAADALANAYARAEKAEAQLVSVQDDIIELTFCEDCSENCDKLIENNCYPPRYCHGCQQKLIEDIVTLKAQVAKESEQHRRWYEGALKLGNKVEVLETQLAEAYKACAQIVWDEWMKNHHHPTLLTECDICNLIGKIREAICAQGRKEKSWHRDCGIAIWKGGVVTLDDVRDMTTRYVVECFIYKLGLSGVDCAEDLIAGIVRMIEGEREACAKIARNIAKREREMWARYKEQSGTAFSIAEEIEKAIRADPRQ